IATRLTTLFVIGALASAAPAYAQSEGGIAEQLFVEARKLMDDGKLEEACKKFGASYDLDRTATGTLLNLALCHEAIHKPATAWAEFRQVAAESEGKRQNRVTLARSHEEKLWPILPRIRIVVPDAVRVTGLKVVLDQAKPLSEAVWNTIVPVDPG